MMGENIYSSVFQLLPGASVILKPETPAFPVVAVNTAYLTLTGMDRESLMHYDFSQAFLNEPQENTANRRNALNEVLHTKHAATCLLKKEITTPGGSCFEEINYLEATYTPLLNDAGSVEYILCSLEKKKASAISEGWVDKTLQAANIGTWQINFLNQKMTCSQSLLDMLDLNAGFKPEIEKCLSFFANEESRECIKNVLKTVDKKDHTFCDTFPVITAAGNKKWLLITGGTFHSTDGVSIRAYGIVHDVTETQFLAEIDNLEKRILELNEKQEWPLSDILSEYLKGIESIYPDLYCSIHKVRDGQLLGWAAPSLPERFLRAIHKLPINENTGSCGTAAYLKKPVYVDDIAHAPEWEQHAQLPLSFGFKACWSYPVIDSGGNVMAVFGMYYKQVQKPGDKELLIIERAAKLLQLILENALKTDLLLTANQLMNQVQELTRLGTWQWNLDTNYVYWSDTLYAIYGIDRNLHPPSFKAYLEVVHPEDRERILQKIHQIQASRESAVLEERIIRPDGGTRYLRSWVQVTAENDGTIIKMIGACLDITEVKLAEMDLKKMYDQQDLFLQKIIGSEKKYSDLFHRIPQPIWVCDPETHKIINANAAAIALYGYTQDEFAALTISDIAAAGDLFPEEGGSALFSDLRKKFFSKEVIVHRKKNGERIYVTILSKHIELNDKISDVLIIQDITEKINYIQAIELQNRKLQEIAWMQSHLVRAPLARIMAIAGIIHNAPAFAIDSGELINAINDSAIELDNVLRPIIDKAEQIKFT